MCGERHDAVLRELERFRADADADADQHQREHQLGSTAHTYPQSLGEWLRTAVQIAGTLSWQAHYGFAHSLTTVDVRLGPPWIGRDRN